MHGKGLPREPSLLLRRIIGRRVLSKGTLKSLRQYPVEPIVNDIVSLVKIRGLEVDSNDIDEFVEHNQELTIGRLYGVALCFTARSYRGEFVTGGEGNNKGTIF
ncbi:hypothetical protein AVEN_126960-1 [Araneus ventricosus]|uniref:Uncharacterized protein n=1 Tax=Araneus ventricosus TaxID=182803 RepID=A0A4Y2EBK5_ARAVE|nr:hypothetical protein AVEN_126960-1 [Araneus ventricosus]